MKGHRLIWREAQEDRQLEQALADRRLRIEEAVYEIGEWVHQGCRDPEPARAFQICRAYYRQRPSVIAPTSRRSIGRKLADKLEIAARLSIDPKAQMALGVRLRKGALSDGSVLKAAHRLYEDIPLGATVSEADIQTLRRHWDEDKDKWLAWARIIPYTFSQELTMKGFMEKRLQKAFSWASYMERFGGMSR